MASDESAPLPSDNAPTGDVPAGQVANCPQCGGPLDVSAYDPLETVQCSHCQASFELFKQLGRFELLQRHAAAGTDAIYSARDSRTGQRAILMMPGAHAAQRADALEALGAEAEDLRKRCGEDLVTEWVTEQLDGVAYQGLLLKEGVAEAEILNLLGIRDSTATVVQTDTPAPATDDDEDIPVFTMEPPLGTAPTETGSAEAPPKKKDEATKIVRLPPPPSRSGRRIPCPHCRTIVNVISKNPLDETACPACHREFEVMRHLGPYCIEHRLGSGGTSTLYLARDTRSWRPVALKVLSAQEMIDNSSAVPTFQREIDAMLKLKHPHIVEVYEGGEWEGFYFMAMEHLQGLTLRQILGIIQHEEQAGEEDASTPPATPDENLRFKLALPELICLEVILRAAQGLGVAHAQGLIHGDVKPENIMVTYDGDVKVIDFGLVQFANTDTLLAEGEAFSVFGTPLYIPPERVRGEPEDFRSDIYSLGATLYHLLRGIPPFRAKSAAELVMMHAEHLLVTFKAYVPSASSTTCRIVEKSLKKRVEDRYSGHIEFSADLTLAKNEILQTMSKQPKDGRAMLRNFMKTMPRPKKSFLLWKHATTSVLKLARKASATARTLLQREPKA